MTNSPFSSLFIFSSIMAFMISIFSAYFTYAAENYPLRKKYNTLNIITTDTLNKNFNNVLIVDVRSKFEFDTMRIANAHHINISTMGFLKNLEKLRAKTDSKWIVLYCNGRDCEKSYQAGTVAKEAEFKNVYVYDAGLYDWVKAHPEKSFLFDSTPVDNTKIIERSEFKSRSLPYENFITGTGVFIDIREPIQRQKIPPIKGLLHIPLDQLITRLEAKAFMDQNIYFIDAVGKQNEWLHYHLKKLGYKNFYFLDGGVAAIKN